jgi:hypothetical protein
MQDYQISLTTYEVVVDDHLDRLIRTSDPTLRTMLVDEIRRRLNTRRTSQAFPVPKDEVARLGLIYGEQYVPDPSHDLEIYFNIANRRFSARNVPTHLAVLYLFGTGKEYRPNLGCLSVAGEALAGYCVQSFGYTPLVRPLGVMPDALCSADKGGSLRIAMVESKASVRSDPEQLILKNVHQFLVDVKTRSTGFRLHYEGYLVCSHFQDGGRVEIGCLYLDLGYYLKGATPVQTAVPSLGSVDSYERPAKRLEDIIRREAATVDSGDEYLISVLSEEANRTATIVLVKDGVGPRRAKDTEDYVQTTAAKIGLAEQWNRGQQMIKHTKGKETREIEEAIKKMKTPELDRDE